LERSCIKLYSVNRIDNKQATGNVVAYTVSVISFVLGERFDLEIVWNNQDISPQLRRQVEVWLKQAGDALFETADGRMISEWAKKPECWEKIKGAAVCETH